MLMDGSQGSTSGVLRSAIHLVQTIPCISTVHTMTKTMAATQMYSRSSPSVPNKGAFRTPASAVQRKALQCCRNGHEKSARLAFDMNFGICKARGSTITSQKACAAAVHGPHLQVTASSRASSATSWELTGSKSTVGIGGWEKQLDIAPSARSCARHIEVANVIGDDDRSGPGAGCHTWLHVRNLQRSWP